MTSADALEILRDNDNNSSLRLQAIDQLEKDLEVLDSLKKKMSYSLDYSVASTDNEKYLCALYLKYGNQKIDYITTSSRNFKKIREWLDNN